MKTPKPLRFCFLEKARGDEARTLLMTVFRDSARSAERNVGEMLTGNMDRKRIATIAPYMGDRLVGIVACRKLAFSDRNKIFSVTDLAVDPNCRRMGIGHRLLQEAENFISDNWLKGEPGFARLSDATKLRDPKSRFYETAGYAPDCTPGRLPCGEPVLVKALNAEPALAYGT
jgi:ribosomal protein S18 acetylase RimI-like enzyme